MHPSVAALFDLTGKTALVTGCNKGIGRAMALALAGAGADIIGVSASMPQYEEELRTAIGQLGRQFTAYQADFSDRQQVYAFLEKVGQQHDRIDILVNNAGTIRRSPAAQHPDADWDLVMAINLDAPFILAREIGKKMIERGSGKIIFTCSLLSFQGGILVPGYAASKAGIASLLKALANEWASKGVQVNGIAPGYIATDNTAPLRQDPVRSQAILDRIPAARWGVPEDLAGATIFLASRASDYVNGTIVVVDGGWLAR
ncbi:2-deoxy-D-gluconate 3-dehydrogenase [Thermoflavifilum aggregans]|uniref:2-deoxy-D-gluconate 3-dehydrogenase n=1 Tax=Thermoflavifilum aggregans TaxID=454188 RepID=A0A2M9CTU6_9BACT|nr:SDR family NAD(P)-dependent oxidoreductase [Thermoflavifilum aggregans]MBX6380279.1 SDR family oxidoreductase [Thermoflavifilum aggregans]PJJ75344.1 2-deoxy-D-gluconate 3-dehydrogenase [Thermoflavifilum aggregans]